MMHRRVLLCTALLGLFAAAAAAQRPIFEPDDFIDPAIHRERIYVLRGVVGGILNPMDHYRKREETAGFVLITNSLYVGSLQFDHKHTEFLGGEDPPPLQRCDCPDPVYFPTPPPSDATPEAPPTGRSDTVQVAYYRTAGPSSDRPTTLRYRLSVTNQQIDTHITSPATGQTERRTGHDRSITLDADTLFRIGRHNIWGSLYIARTWRSGTPDDRAQNELVYVAVPPGWSGGPFLVRAKLKVGVITGRGPRTVNVINPYFEAIWRHQKSKVNFHSVWSVEGTSDGAEGWRVNHQIAIFAEWLYVALLKR